MADMDEKSVPTHDVSASPNYSEDVAVTSSGTTVPVLPAGRIYRVFGTSNYKLWYASPQVQLVVVAFVCFMCPGMYNALSGMGGGGQVSADAADKAGTALYSTFAVVAFFAGTFTNRLGVRTALGLGGTGYVIYVGSFLSFSHDHNYGFTIFAGAWLGICAGLLWSAQGQILMSYPPEAEKGRYISWFWMIFNLGGVIGALIPLGQNIHTTTAATVSDGTYIGFIVLTLIGALLSFALVDGKKVIRRDGSHVILMKNPTWQTEIYGLWETFFTDPYILFLFPMFWSSNWFYTYHFNGVNLAFFNLRTRSLNNVLYWSCQIVGALVFGYALDYSKLRRTTRAKAGWAALFVLCMVIYGGGYAFQKGYTRADVNAPDFHPKDWSDSGYVGPMFLYMFYGFFDAAWQTYVYWFMGALTNNGRKAANFAGFYKGIQSAAAAIMWRLDGIGISYFAEFGSSWGLLAGSLLIALPILLLKVRDHVPLEDDLAFTDETAQDVLGGKFAEEPRDVEEHIGGDEKIAA